jgi:DNA-binding CsgD family transcriptional regulator
MNARDQRPATTPPTRVISEDRVAGEFVVDLLAAGGFVAELTREFDPAQGDAAIELVVRVSFADVQTRIAAIRATCAAYSHAATVATMPTAAGGSAVRKALQAGADGIVFDDEVATALVATARAVVAGQVAVPRAVRRQLAPRPLSFREKQILNLVVQGYTNRQIADELFVAESTVKTHLSSAFEKLDTRSRAEAAALILDPEEGHGLGILSVATSPTTRLAA